MVGFVLHHPGEEPPSLEDNFISVKIVAAHNHPLGAMNRKIETRKGKTPFYDGNGPASALDLRIDKKTPGRRPALFSRPLQVKDKKTHREADLRGRHGNALLCGQGVPKIPDGGANLRRDRIDRLRRHPEERVDMGNEGSDRQKDFP